MNEPREASIWRQGDRWIGFSAKMDEETNDGKGIQTSVQDHGVGTNSSDSPQIFEPLYRSSPAIAAQIHGTELGLSIAKRNAEAFGRNLSVVSEAGVGERLYPAFAGMGARFRNGNYHAQNQSGDLSNFSLAALQLPLKRSEI